MCVICFYDTIILFDCIPLVYENKAYINICMIIFWRLHVYSLSESFSLEVPRMNKLRNVKLLMNKNISEHSILNVW